MSCVLLLRPAMRARAAVLLLGLTSTAAPALAGIVPFTEEAVARGVTYVMESANLYGSGCAFADLDGDGDQDIVITGADSGQVGLFENNGSGHFINESSASGIPLLSEASGAILADYDGDGDLDMYLTQHINTTTPLPNVLARNEGDFQFTNQAVAAGVEDGIGTGQGVAFGDYDGDGWLDLYVCNYSGANRLYHNLGNGTFVDVAADLDVDNMGLSYQAVWFDYDLDGDVDLYLSNDRGHLPVTGFIGNQLWRNDSGVLVNVSAGSGADDHLFSMGVGCGDLDGNGWPDLYCTNIANTSPPGPRDTVGGVFPLYLNAGDGTFAESSQLAGIDALDQPHETGWSAIFFDFDNDTYLDVYVNLQFAPNLFFECNGSFPCTSVAGSMGITGNFGASFGSAVGDVDGDGDQDLLINNLGTNVQLFINHQGEQASWIRYRMVGLAPNLWAVGGRTRTRIGAQWQLREILAGGNNFLGQNELTMHVGLLGATEADEVEVTWPGGKITRTLTNLPAEQTWTLYPPSQLGDPDGDEDVDLDDFLVLADCYQEPFAPGCEIMDFDGDSDVDADDADAFIAAFSGVPADCDDDDQPDMLEILQNPASDANNNGVLDSCEGGCTNIADCGDMDDNGVRDNPCLWYQCAAGNCQSMARTTQADLGGPTGACVIDGVGDANDRFHGLNCFSNVTTSGAPGYPCEDDPPAAVNVDAGGPATCVPDGVCDANEAFHALNNFSNVNFIGQAGYPCVCGGPAPAGPATGAQVAPAPAAWTGLTLEAPRRVRPGERLEVDVFLDDAVAALRGYQLHLGTSGGTSGALQLMDIVIREPSVFSPAAEGDLGERRATSDERPYWSAFNIGTQQMLAGLDAVEGVPAAGGAYLATFIYRVSTDAAGTFAVEVLHAPPGQDGSRRTFLFGHAARPIGIREVAPATVTVLKPRAR